MPKHYVDTDELLAGPFYAFGLLLIGLPMMDFATSIVPVHFANLQWRFATLGLLSNFLMTPMLGLGVMIVTAAVREHRGTMRFFSIVSGVIALSLIGMLVLFSLDAIQLNASMPADQVASFRSAAAKAVAKHAAGIIVLAWMSVATWQVASQRP
ncbi:MAG: hypothetical protein U0163_12180 [Gemmatimonadaceae bacterium]